MAVEQKATHTPGPWAMVYGTDGKHLIFAEDGPVATVAIRADADEQEANALVVLYSGEVLDALKEMTDDLEARWDMRSPSTNPGIKHCVERARIVIAKVEGPRS